MIKVRFHLAQGENYLKWQVKAETKEGVNTSYYDPEERSLIMYDCKLVNQRGTAEKIMGGENKTVCAWVQCEGISVFHPKLMREEEVEPIFYNPRTAPYWRDKDGNDIDGERIKCIISKGRNLYARIEEEINNQQNK